MNSTIPSRTLVPAALGLLIALIAGSVASPATMAAEAKLKAASFLPARVVYAKYFYQWVDQVNEQCAGKVNVSVVGPAAVKSLEQWNALKTGVVDMHFGPPNYYKGAMVEADVTSLANRSSAEQRENGAWAIINELHNEKLNAWYLTHIIDGVRFLLVHRQARRRWALRRFPAAIRAGVRQVLQVAGARNRFAWRRPRCIQRWSAKPSTVTGGRYGA